ncbi:MAG: hypothetical protein U5K29_06760 [Acidimicrobiales bacterium]|nr:hypothetical protein [Acidimicrobiales bacterium]
MQFTKPLRPGARVRTRCVITEKRLSSKPGRGILTSQADLLDEDDDPVLRIRVACMLATRPSP